MEMHWLMFDVLIYQCCRYDRTLYWILFLFVYSVLILLCCWCCDLCEFCLFSSFSVNFFFYNNWNSISYPLCAHNVRIHTIQNDSDSPITSLWFQQWVCILNLYMYIYCHNQWRIRYSCRDMGNNNKMSDAS